MRILLLTQWYSPEPAKLFADLAKGLQKLGHEVTVLTGFPNWPSGKLYPGYRLRLWQKETLEGVPVVRVFLYPNHGRSALLRVLNLGSFLVAASSLGLFLVPRPDIIHAIQPPTAGWAAWMLSRARRIPFTYEVQDMWPESLRASGLVRNERMLDFIGWFTKRIENAASAIRVISPGFKANLIQKGHPPEKIHVISNWVDTDFYHPEPKESKRAKALGLAGRFNILYGGVIGLSQGLDTILDAALLVSDLPDVQFVFVGDGTERKRLDERVDREKLSNVKFLGAYPVTAMTGIYACADVLLVSLRDDPLFRITIPHKIFSCLASGKPILAALEGDGVEVIKGAHAGIACKPGDANEIAAAIRELYKMTPAQREELGANGRQAACSMYHQDLLVRHVSEMLRNAAFK